MKLVKYAILLAFLCSGCSVSADQRASAITKAKAYCACHEGVYIVHFFAFNFSVHCSDGSNEKFQYDSEVFPACEVK